MPKQIVESHIKLEVKISDTVTKLARVDRDLPNGLASYDLAMELQSNLNRPVKVVIGGEFSSGKSTFTKMLLGQHVVQMQAAASALPTVHFQYSTEHTMRAISANGSRDISDIGTLSEEELRELECLEVMVDLPFLKKFELFDTPGTSDPTRDIDQLLAVAEQADFIIWCTNATQAWRASEKRMWDAMPPTVKERSLLLVTHVDLPSVKSSIERLMKRLKKEASSEFREIIPIALLSASTARDSNGSITDSKLWKSSGGAECIAAMATGFSEIREDIIERTEHEFETKIIPFIDQHISSTKPFMNYWSRQLADIKAHIKEADSTDISARYATHLEAMLKFIDGNFQLTSTEVEILTSRISEAQVVIGNALMQEDKTAISDEIHAVIKQLDWEFNHMSILD